MLPVSEFQCRSFGVGVPVSEFWCRSSGVGVSGSEFRGRSPGVGVLVSVAPEATVRAARFLPRRGVFQVAKCTIRRGTTIDSTGKSAENESCTVFCLPCHDDRESTSRT